MFRAVGIASPAAIESPESYEAAIPYYREHSYTYIPMPTAGTYYHVVDEEMRQIDEAQYVDPGITMLAAFDLLMEYPFLLIDRTEMQTAAHSDREPADDTGDELGEDKQLYIITLADANKRRARELFYHVISEFEIQLAKLVKGEYPDSLIKEATDEEVERWYRAKLEGLEMHIAEHMYLSTLLKVIGNEEALFEQLGFPSKTQFDNGLGGLNQLRHKVMHPTRALVHDVDDLEKQVDRVRRAQDALGSLDSSVIQSRQPESINFSDS